MGDGDGGVGGEQERRHRFADDVGAANDYGAFASKVADAVFQDKRAAERGAGDGDGVARPQAAHVHRVEAVHVLVRRDGVQYGVGIEVGGQR